MKRGGDGQVTSATSIAVFDLRVGDCLVPPADDTAELERIPVVPCSESHTQEVFAIRQIPGGDVYPGEAALTSFSDGACLELFESYIGVAYQDSKLFFTYLLPSERSWKERDDRDVICVVSARGEQLTTSVRGSRR